MNQYVRERRQMNLGVSLSDPFSQRPELGQSRRFQSDEKTLFAISRQIAEAAERARFDAILIGRDLRLDNRGAEFEPDKLLAALVRSTERIGLVAPVSTENTDPYSIAGSFSALDHLSRGRAGLALAPEKETKPGVATERVEDYVNLMTGLWSSWEIDAIDYSQANAGYESTHSDNEVVLLSRNKMPKPNSIAAAPELNGHPVLVQSVVSEADEKLAVRSAEVALTLPASFDEARRIYARLKGKLGRCGRSPDSMKIMAGIMPIVGRAMHQAFERYEELIAALESSGFSGSISSLTGSGDVSSVRSGWEIGWKTLENDRPDRSVEPVPVMTGTIDGYPVLLGTPQMMADELEKWFFGDAADGFLITPPYLSNGFEDFVNLVVPELQIKGVFRTDYSGHTLRDHLGVERSVNPVGKRMFHFSLAS